MREYIKGIVHPKSFAEVYEQERVNASYVDPDGFLLLSTEEQEERVAKKIWDRQVQSVMDLAWRKICFKKMIEKQKKQTGGVA